MGVRESLLNTITSVSNGDFIRVVTEAGASSKATLANLMKSFETGLGSKSSLTTSDYIRVVGSDNVSYKQQILSMQAPFRDYSGTTTDLLGTVTALQKGTYFFRMDNVTGFPVTGGVVFRIVKAHASGDTRASILAVPMNSSSPNVYTAFVPASATSITWVAQPTRAEVDALGQRFSISTSGQTFTISNNYRGVLYIIDSSTPRCGEYFVISTGAGAVSYKAVLSASDITLTVGTNSLAITPASGARAVMFTTLQGTVS